MPVRFRPLIITTLIAAGLLATGGPAGAEVIDGSPTHADVAGGSQVVARGKEVVARGSSIHRDIDGSEISDERNDNADVE